MTSIPQLCPDETCASCFFEHGVCLRAVFAHFDWWKYVSGLHWHQCGAAGKEEPTKWVTWLHTALLLETVAATKPVPQSTGVAALPPLRRSSCTISEWTTVYFHSSPYSTENKPTLFSAFFFFGRKGFASTVEEEKVSFASPKKLDSSVWHDILPPCVIYTFASLFCRSLPFSVRCLPCFVAARFTCCSVTARFWINQRLFSCWTPNRKTASALR